jgi:hypothetical protein
LPRRGGKSEADAALFFQPLRLTIERSIVCVRTVAGIGRRLNVDSETTTSQHAHDDDGVNDGRIRYCLYEAHHMKLYLDCQ